MKNLIIIFSALLLTACIGETTYVAKVDGSMQYMRVKRDGTKVTMLIADNKKMNDGAFLVKENCLVMDNKNWTCIEILGGTAYELKMTNDTIYWGSSSDSTDKYVPLGFFD